MILNAAQNYYVLIAAVIIISSALVLMIAAIGVRKVIRNGVELRREKRRAQLRPQILEIVAEGEFEHSELDAVIDGQFEIAQGIVWALLPKVRGSVRTALVDWLTGVGAVDEAVAKLGHRGVVQRCRAAERIGRTGNIELVDNLTALLKDRSGEVRIVAARSLGKLGNPNSVAALLDTLEGRHRVGASLIAMSITHIGSSATPQLTEGLLRSSVRARLVCAELLGLHGELKAVRNLAHLLLTDEDQGVRVSCARALGRIGAPTCINALLRASAPANHAPVRTAAVRAMGQIGGIDALASLHACATSEDDSLSLAAMRSLAELDSEGAKVLDLLASGDDVYAMRARDWIWRRDLKREQNRKRIERRRHRRVGAR